MKNTEGEKRVSRCLQGLPAAETPSALPPSALPKKSSHVMTARPAAAATATATVIFACTATKSVSAFSPLPRNRWKPHHPISPFLPENKLTSKKLRATASYLDSLSKPKEEKAKPSALTGAYLDSLGINSQEYAPCVVSESAEQQDTSTIAQNIEAELVAMGAQSMTTYDVPSAQRNEVAEVSDVTIATDTSNNIAVDAFQSSSFFDTGNKLETTGMPPLDKSMKNIDEECIIPEEQNKIQQLMTQVKEAGTAGAISYALWELAFWVVSFPLCCFAFYKYTGHWPDFSDKEDLQKLGTEIFTFVNVARFALPLRIGLALSTAPWINENILERFWTKDQLPICEEE